MTVIYALLALAIGGALLAVGYRLAHIAIPLWGFLAGLSVGGSIIAAMSDVPFLGTFLGVVVGLMLGLVFAVLSYLYYNIAVVVLLGAAGYWLGSSFIMLFGFDPGILSVTVGLALGLLAGITALLVNAPKYVLIIGTSFAGAMAAIGGLLLLFNQIELNSFNYEAIANSVSNSFIWTLLALVIMGAGIAFQVATTIRYSFEEWTFDHLGTGDGHGLTTHHSGSH
jgi:hypothetical protein